MHAEIASVNDLKIAQITFVNLRICFSRILKIRFSQISLAKFNLRKKAKVKKRFAEFEISCWLS